MAARDWIAFWDTEHPIYVNARHREAHYRRIADDLLRYVPQDGAVMDYGCGEALSADRVADKAGRLILAEAAPSVRSGLAARFSGHAKIAVMSPEEVAALPDGTLDVIVLHSVAQYLSSDELDALLVQFRRLLAPGGLFVLGDVIPRKVSAATDALALLRFGAAEGFLLAAGIGLVRTAFSGYWRLRNTLGLARYDAAEVMSKLTAAGFLAKRATPNIGHNPARMTFLAWSVDAAAEAGNRVTPRR